MARMRQKLAKPLVLKYRVTATGRYICSNKNSQNDECIAAAQYRKNNRGRGDAPGRESARGLFIWGMRAHVSAKSIFGQLVKRASPVRFFC